MNAPEPTWVGHLFRDLYRELVELLRGLNQEEWEQPTSAGTWRVRDIVAHLLDGDLRRLSIARDDHRPPLTRPITTYAELVTFLNDLNAAWLRAADRLSSSVLVDLVEHVGSQASAFLGSVDPMGRAPIAVAWAGQAQSPNWLDVGREYTERWHHQDQIREAVRAPALLDEKWLRPVLEISVWALPRAYEDVSGDEGDAVEIRTTGTVSETWSLVQENAGWTLYSGAPPAPKSRITLDGEIAARLLLHRTAEDSVGDRILFEGEERMLRPFLHARAVMV